MTRKPHALEAAAMVFLIVTFLASMVCADHEPAPRPAVADAIADAQAAARADERPEPWSRDQHAHRSSSHVGSGANP